MTKKFLEIDLVNIIASMSLNIPNYPRIFYEAGYRIEYFEKEFYINKNGNKIEVKFDIVINNVDNNKSLHFECKGGGIQKEQLEKYSNIKQEDVVLIGGVSSNNPSKHSFQVGYVVNSNKMTDIVPELEKFQFAALLCSGNPTIISKGNLELIDFKDKNLSELFSDPIDYPEYVYEIFRIGATTPDKKIILLITTSLISCSLRKKDDFTLDEICSEVFATESTFFYNNVGNQEQKSIRKRINRLLNKMAMYELSEYFDWNFSTKTGKLKKIKYPSSPIHFKNMRDLANEMAERVNLGNPVPAKYLKGRAEGQLSLFEED